MTGKRQINSKDAIFIFIASFVLSLILSLPLAVLEGDEKVLISYLLPQVAYAAGIFIYLAVARVSVKEALPIKKSRFSWVMLALMVPIAVGLFLQDLLLVNAFAWLFEAMGVRLSVTLPSGDGNLIVYWITLIIICTLPPLVEEFMFRGCFVSGYRSRGAVTSILVSAAFFALSHFNAIQIIHQFIVGIVFGYIAYKTRHIIYTVVAHAINNIMALGLNFWDDFTKLSEMTWKNTGILAGLMVLGIGILLATYLAFKKAINKIDSKDLQIKMWEKANSHEKADSRAEDIVCYNTKEEFSVTGEKTCTVDTITDEEDKKLDAILKRMNDSKRKKLDVLTIVVMGLCLVITILTTIFR